MPITRNVKPDFFKNEELYQCEVKHGLPVRVAYIGLWTCCDREGRFAWKPNRLKLDILPYDDEVDFEDVLDILCSEGWVTKYHGRDASGNYVECGVIPKFKLHQHINNKEPASVLPDPPPGVEMAEVEPRRGRRTEPTLLVKNLNKDVASSNAPKFTLSRGSHFRMDPGSDVTILVSNGGDMSAMASFQDASGTDIELVFPTCNTGVSISISTEKVEQYQQSYSGVDIITELKQVKQWLIDNPSKRKTVVGFGAFLNSWFGRSQNRGGYSSSRFTGFGAIPVVKPAAVMTVQAEDEITRALRLAGVGGASHGGMIIDVN